MSTLRLASRMMKVQNETHAVRLAVVKTEFAPICWCGKYNKQTRRGVGTCLLQEEEGYPASILRGIIVAVYSSVKFPIKYTSGGASPNSFVQKRTTTVP